MKNLKLSIMKKKYIQPNLTTVVLTGGTLLNATSPLTISDTQVSSGMVKSDRGSRSNYNIWDEDWSKE